jgi:beta-glucosidase
MVSSSSRRALLAAVLSLLAALAAASSAVAADPPWRDPGLPPQQRADAALAALTQDQKIAIALGDFAPIVALGGPSALPNDDGPSGIRADGTTAFPSAQTLAATFDRSLARAYGDAIAAEARGKGFDWWLGPAMDIARTPLAGRQPENLGEDPFLAGETVAQEVAAAKARHVIATLKHYVANNQETERIGFQQPPNGAVRSGGIDVIAAERALQEIYEAPFKRAIRAANADAVMCSYNRLNGPQTCESPALLADLKASGFAGFVVPDFIFAVRDPLAATLAGVDVPALGGPGGRTAAMFTSGQVPQARLDDIVRRTLFGLFDSGVWDDPVGPAQANVSTPAHRDLATRVAQDGTVLLRNDRDALPLAGRGGRPARSIAVIGPSGNDATFVSGGSSGVPLAPGQAVTPLDGIRARAAAAGVSVTAAQGSLGDAPLPALVPSAVLTPTGGAGGNGLLGEYFSNGDLAGTPALTRVDPTVDLAGAPAGVGPLWSARWTGTLTPSESGLYRLTLLQAGIARLFVDGKLVASGYREGVQFLVGPNYPTSGIVALKADRPVSIRIEYTSKAQLFGAQIHFQWQPPSASQIPAAVEAARHADAAVVVVNNAQGEGMDRGETLALPGDQDALVEAVAAVNRRTIVVVNTGGPVLMPWLDRVGAVLQVWYPGQQFGAALAGVLFGDADPGGRLPVTFPADDGQGPAPPSQPERYPGVNGVERYDEGIFVGYRFYDQVGQRPLFPFGYGLSYARFRFDDLRVDARGAVVTASVRVRNVSDRAGSTVAQAYVSLPRATGEPPRRLEGYEKVRLAAGRSARVTFTLGPDELSFFDEAAHRFVVAPGRYRLSVGASSRDLPEHEDFTIGGRRDR